MQDINIYFIIPKPQDTPIKIVIEDNVKITSNENVIEIKRHLSSMEVKNLINNIFGTTNIGVIDCSDISEQEFNEIIDQLDPFN